MWDSNLEEVKCRGTRYILNLEENWKFLKIEKMMSAKIRIFNLEGGD